MSCIPTTGSAQGLGRHVAETLLHDGYQVVVHARNPCVESYVAESCAAIDAQLRPVGLPGGLSTSADDGVRPASSGDAMLSAAKTTTWTTVPEQGQPTMTGRST
jgi:NAD(P)-dependent dehydrogenase (short-subunit alcohol dehydrogenase family)